MSRVTVMTDEKRFRTRLVISGFVFLAVVIALMKLLGDSYLVSGAFLVGWAVLLAYMLRLRSMGKK